MNFFNFVLSLVYINNNTSNIKSDSFLDKIHIGKHNNIYRKHLGAFNVIRGKGSYLFGALAKSGEGKSLEDEITFLIMIPQEYIFKKNNMTEASFLRCAKVNKYHFNRRHRLR